MERTVHLHVLKTDQRYIISQCFVGLGSYYSSEQCVILPTSTRLQGQCGTATQALAWELSSQLYSHK